MASPVVMVVKPMHGAPGGPPVTPAGGAYPNLHAAYNEYEAPAQAHANGNGHGNANANPYVYRGAADYKANGTGAAPIGGGGGGGAYPAVKSGGAKSAAQVAAEAAAADDAAIAAALSAPAENEVKVVVVVQAKVGNYAALAARDYGFDFPADCVRLLGAARNDTQPAWESARTAWVKDYFDLNVREQINRWNHAAEELLVAQAKAKAKSPEKDKEKEKELKGALSPPATPWQQLDEDKRKVLVRCGIPASLRADVWWCCSGAMELAKKLPAGHFAACVERAAQVPHMLAAVEAGVEAAVVAAGGALPLTAQQLTLVATASKEIARDVDRTFGHHPLFRSQVGRKALSRVLNAFAVHDPHIGYCQSLNFIAAWLLLVYEEERAFVQLIALTQRLLPHADPQSGTGGYYTPTMSGAHADVFVLRSLARKRLPRLSDKMDKLGVDWSIAWFAPFITLFVNSLPVESAMRVWDALFLEGDKVLFRVGLALMVMNETQLLQCKDAETMYRALGTVSAMTFDADALMSKAFTGVGSLGRSTIEASRKKHHARLMAAVAQVQKNPPANA